MSLVFYLDCQHCGTHLFSKNITHNLNEMAEACGLYDVLWHASSVVDGKPVQPKASTLTDQIEKGLQELIADPEKYKQYNPDNGWGDYDGLVEFAATCLEACKQFPDAAVWCCR